jgi:phospholipid transport system substrate-binding protein
MKKIILLFALIFVFSKNSFADETKEVEKFINNLGDQIIEVARDENMQIGQRRYELIKIIDRVIDTNWISKFVLGRHYRTASAKQKEEFRILYREFMINTYSPKFTGYSGEKFTINSIVNNGNYYTAACLFSPKEDVPTINIDFRVRKNTQKPANPKFLVFDILAEGISLIETQRSEFGSAIDRDGMEKFMKDLKERTVEIKKEQKASKEASKKTSK